MEFEKAKELFKKNTETMAAYSHAMGVLSYDSETAAPKNSAEGLGRTYGVFISGFAEIYFEFQGF